MGNCQAIDAATLVIQHPSGKVDNFYWPVSANEVMKSNPGHYVALLLSTTLYPTSDGGQIPAAAAVNAKENNGAVRFTRIKLLKPTDTLALGHVYRLITSQEVKKVLLAKKQAQMQKNQSDSTEKQISQTRRSDLDENHQVAKNERNRHRTASSNVPGATIRSRTTWQPSLKSISEAGS